MLEGLPARNVLSVILILCFLIHFDDVSSERNYLIDTEKCQIPNYEPFSEETLKLWSLQTYVPCSQKPLLTYISKTDHEAFIHVVEHLIPLYGKNITCCISTVERKKIEQFPDSKISLTVCEDFISPKQLHSDTILVKCRDGSGIVVYSNVHSVILKAKYIKKRENLREKPISVLLIVLDSVSRLNFMRTMPKTRGYLLMNNFIEMEGYNKIADNSFPNFMALLSGLNEKDTIARKCGLDVSDLDNCPLLWYDIRDKGYTTTYGKDWGEMNVLINNKGFNKKPTDFYFRPYVLASETLATLKIPYCAGPETSGERQLNLATDFAKTFKGLPYFGIFWMGSFSHHALNDLSGFDDKLRLFFANLKAEGVLDDSIVVLLSDHGMRYDAWIRKTLSGWYEERLPMNLISVPRWFQEIYPREYMNLQMNSKQLTSTYDFHMTLQHIFELSLTNFISSPIAACPNCVSFFEKITPRTCTEAGIPEEWCSCVGDFIPIDHTSESVTKGIRFVLDHIESIINKNHLEKLCSSLKLSKVKLAAETPVSNLTNEKYLFLSFEMEPFIDFIVTLKYKTTNPEPEFHILKDVIRLISMESQDRCTTKYWNYCACRSPDTSRSFLKQIAEYLETFLEYIYNFITQ